MTLPLARDLALVDADGRWRVEPATVDLWVAASPADRGLHAAVQLV